VIAVLTLAHAQRTAAAAGPPDAARQAYAAFLGITAVNPTTVVYFAAVAVGNRGLVSDALEGAVFVASW